MAALAVDLVAFGTTRIAHLSPAMYAHVNKDGKDSSTSTAYRPGSFTPFEPTVGTP